MTARADLLRRLGEPGTPKHWEEAFTHQSFAVENGLAFNYQRLEFLGDAVLETLVSEWLVRRYPAADEGELSKIRAALVREESFAGLARELRLGPEIRLGKGEKESGGDDRDSVLADIFEAMIGCLYLDFGFEACRRFVVALFEEFRPDPAAAVRDANPKGALQELTQARWGEHPVYRVLDTSGPDHAPHFNVEVRVHGVAAEGRGEGRRAAETDAARKLLAFFAKEGTPA